MREDPTNKPESGSSKDRSREADRVVSSRVEHGDVKVVAVNDPFIEPKYAVSLIMASCSPFGYPSVGG